MTSTEANYSYTERLNTGLLTFRGETWTEIAGRIHEAVQNPQQFIADIAVLAAIGNTIPVVNTDAPAYAPPAAAAPQPAYAPEPQQGPPPTWAAPAPTAAPPSSGHTCVHGERKFVTGQGAKGPWKAYMCNTPKGTPNQCAPEWVN